MQQSESKKCKLKTEQLFFRAVLHGILDILRGVPAADLSNKEAEGIEEKHNGNAVFKRLMSEKKEKGGVVEG